MRPLVQSFIAKLRVALHLEQGSEGVMASLA